MNEYVYKHVDNIINCSHVLLSSELSERQENFLNLVIHNARQFREIGHTYEGMTQLSREQRHKLANPLTPMLGYAELLLSGTMGSLTNEQFYYAQRICESTYFLRDVVDMMVVRAAV
ncbi:MAG: hypothetical protein OHK0046_15220 [Anaerolineae bacterium]